MFTVEKRTTLMIASLSAERLLLFIDLCGFYYPTLSQVQFFNAEIIENIKKRTFLGDG